MPITIAEAIDQLGKLGGRVQAHVARGLSYGLEKHVREPAVVETVKHGVGRRLWGDKRAGAFAMFRREPIQMTSGRLTTRIVVKGLPALAETGGRTLPHRIESHASWLARSGASAIRRGKGEKGFALLSMAARAPGRLLTFTVRGRRMAAPWVQHPGSQIAKTEVMARALESGGPKVVEEIRKSLDAFIASVQG